MSGAKLWAWRYNGRGKGSDSAVSAAVSPDGSSVFVAGGSTGAGSGFDYTTIAYRAATGATAWARRYNGPASRKDYAHWIAVSRNGRMVFVTGATRARPSGVDYGTIAYNARTGARLWLARYNGPGNNTDDALSVAADPGGRRVYVTGYSRGARSGQDYGTIAYNAATGARLWTARYDGPLHHNDEALAMTVGPDGHEVFVTGRSENAQFHYVTVAYRATTGGRVWATDSGLGTPGAIAIGPELIAQPASLLRPSLSHEIHIVIEPARAGVRGGDLARRCAG